jgi:hypothetical protein
MPGFNTLPAVGGGGGQANMTYVASIHMQTYNRSWAQGGTAGYYAIYSTNQENGYAYFVGATTTGVALNRLANITHSFTRIDIIAPQNDMLSLYKAKVKATTEFPDAFAAFSSFPAVITSSGNFVLPNNALPLVNVLVNGGGGGSGNSSNTNHGGSGGGGGGGVVKLTAYQAVGTTGVTVGGGAGAGNNYGGRTYFGNVYALGGGYGNGHNQASQPAGGGPTAATGGGGGGYQGQSHAAAVGATQTAATGLGTSGAPVYFGGTTGGRNTSNDSNGHNRGGGGAGSGGNGADAGHNSGGNGGIGHVSDIEGSNHSYGAGGRGSAAHGSHGTNGWEIQGIGTRGHGGAANQSSGAGGGTGVVIVRYYIP